MSGSINPDSHSPIDVVIAWVDGDDPEFRALFESFIEKGQSVILSKNITTRYASVNEIRYCVLSILRFAPFVRNIFIVTHGQIPQVFEDIERYFPGRKQSVKIVDHKDIFSGYEEFLPVFSSRSIETMLWRIEGLADSFVYFNDDIFLIREVKPGDWFLKGRPVLRGNWTPIPVHKIAWDFVQRLFSRLWNRLPAYFSRPSFHMGQWQSACLLGYNTMYFRNWHTPHTFTRSRMEGFFQSNKGLIRKNISFRFRNHAQFSPVSLANHLELKSGNKNISGSALSYLQPVGRGEDYIEIKTMQCEKNEDIKFMCVQSLELCSTQQQNQLFQWLDKVLKLEKNTVLTSPFAAVASMKK